MSRGPDIRCSWKRTSIAAEPGDAATVASSARNTVGPVVRREHPDGPGSHHQTPCASAGSTAMQSPGWPTPTTLRGVAVTM